MDTAILNLIWSDGLMDGLASAGIRRLVDDSALRDRLGRALAARAGEATWDARARRILDWMGSCG